MAARVQDKVALISGGASGIGRASALLLAREGPRVAVADINEPGAERVAEEIRRAGGEADGFLLDVTSEAGWVQAIARVRERWGRLQILVASAGVVIARPVEEMELEEWRRVMAVNLDGVFLGVKHAIPAMRSGSGGSIILLSSAAGLKAYPGASAYGAGKAALRGARMRPTRRQDPREHRASQRCRDGDLAHHAVFPETGAGFGKRG